MSKQNKANPVPAAKKANAKVDTDMVKSHVFKFGKSEYDGVSLANEAEGLQGKADSLADDQDVFSQKFMLFAGTCKSVNEFLSLAGAVEARKGWKSKQNPEGAKTAPTVWKQYKSNVKTAWDKFGIKPNDVKTGSELNKKLNEARKAQKQEQDEKSGDATTGALVHAVNLDAKLGAAIGAVTQIFDKLQNEDQQEMLEELHTLVDYFEDKLSATTEEQDDAQSLIDALDDVVEQDAKQAATA